MAYGSNGKRTTNNNNNSSQQDNDRDNNHHMVHVSTPSLTTTTTISLPSNPRPTPNHFPSFSGTVHSFNNSAEGLQDFNQTKIKSPAIGDSFNNLGSGSQTFRGAEIRCAAESSKGSKSILPFKGNHVAQYGGTLHSFNNKGRGSQSFDGFKLN